MVRPHQIVTNKTFVKHLDRVMMVVSVLFPLAAAPQVFTIYYHHDASGVSLLTWLLFSSAGLVFLLYGIVHRIKPLIVSQVLWFFIDVLVVAGILLYR